MAVYKVIQDVEAEDKLLGPLTFKGFIYILIAGALAFINFKLLVSTELGAFRWLLIFIFGLPMLLFGLLASPLGREQPTEVWLLSRIQFLLKPRQRIWNQSGLSHLVTVTAPKKQELHLTKDLSQSEVKSRLRALAMTMDSRGWAVKNATAGPAAKDVMDEQNSPTAQKFDKLMRQKEGERKEEVAHVIKTARHKKPRHAEKHAEPKKEPPVTAKAQTAKLELAQSGNDLSVDSIARLASRPPRVEEIGPGEVVINLR